MCTSQGIMRNEHICATTIQVKKKNKNTEHDPPPGNLGASSQFPPGPSFPQVPQICLACLEVHISGIAEPCTLSELHGYMATVPHQFTDLVSLSKRTQVGGGQEMRPK